MGRLLIAAVSLAAGALLAAGPGGCGAASPPAPTTVRGSVFFRGEPLADGVIVFAPDADRGTAGKPLRATIGPDGAFELRLDGSANVPAGWYRVALADPPARDLAFPAALRRPDLSGILRQVQAGKANAFEFRIDLSPGLPPGV